MSSSSRFLWCAFLLLVLGLSGLLGCSSRYEPGPKASSDTSATASGESGRAASPAESKPPANVPSQASTSGERKEESGGGLFRAMLEPLFSQTNGSNQAGEPAGSAPGGAKPTETAASDRGSGPAGTSAGPSAGPTPASLAGGPAEPASRGLAPADIPPPAEAAGAAPPAGPGPIAAALGSREAAMRSRLFSDWQIGQPLDLLSELNRSWHVLGPKWQIEPASIVSPDPASFTGAGRRAVLLMPCTVPREFRWTMVVERVSGRESLNVFFPLPNLRRTMVVLDGFGSRASGLHLLDGAPADRNETTYRGPLFLPGKPTTIGLAVRQNLIHVTWEGEKIIDYRGEQTRLTLDRQNWGMIPHNRIGLAVAGGSVFRITKLELEPLSKEIMGPPSFGLGFGGAKWASPAPEEAPAGRFAGPLRPPFMRPEPPGGVRPRPMPPGPERPPGMGTVPAPAPAPGIAGIPAPSSPAPAAAAERPLPPPVDVPAAASARQDSVCLVEQALAGGTGFVIAKNLVATNAHVMEGAFLEETKLHFSTPSAVTYKPKAIVYENVPEDLCLLEVAEVDRPPIPLVADNNVPRGQKVFIIGNPSIAPGMTARNTIGAGTVTTVMHIEGFDFYQIDGNVNPGSSGGPALNERGELVGIISMKAEDRVADAIRDELRRLDEKFRAESQQERNVGIAYSIPIVRVRTALEHASKATEATKRQNLVLHHSRSLFQRAAAVAIYHTLRLEVNVPKQVRDQAWKIRTAPRRFGPRIEEIELMPPAQAQRLASLLKTPEARESVRTAGKNLKERLEALQQYEQADAEVLQNLQRLLETAQKAEEAAADPPKSYQRFVDTLKGLRNSLKRTLPPLAERLEP